CPAQQPVAHHHRDRDPGRILDRWPRCRRGVVPLPGHWWADLPGRPRQGLPDARGRCAHAGHHLHGRDLAGGFAVLGTQSAHPLRGGRMSLTSNEVVSARDAPQPVSALSERIRLLFKSPTFLAGFITLLFWIGWALFGARLLPAGPYADDLMGALMAPSAAHWFGTDSLGRDIFSRVIVGARDILTIAPLSTILGTLVGTAL